MTKDYIGQRPWPILSLVMTNHRLPCIRSQS